MDVVGHEIKSSHSMTVATRMYPAILGYCTALKVSGAPGTVDWPGSWDIESDPANTVRGEAAEFHDDGTHRVGRAGARNAHENGMVESNNAWGADIFSLNGRGVRGQLVVSRPVSGARRYIRLGITLVLLALSSSIRIVVRLAPGSACGGTWRMSGPWLWGIGEYGTAPDVPLRSGVVVPVVW
ncbi:hypothetical protein Efla_004563 [Eimeria flavescens]